MDRRSLYDDDVYAWAKQQAAALRRLARTGRDLPNELDLENVAEEIEDVGKSELRAAQSFIRNILVHLLLLAFDTHASARDRWRLEIITFHRALKAFATPSMRQLTDMEALWSDARDEAEAGLAIYGRPLPGNIARACPLDFDKVTAESFDADAALARLADAGAGPPE
jgi:hypothetical protein